jgi:hypothetical protein
MGECPAYMGTQLCGPAKVALSEPVAPPVSSKAAAVFDWPYPGFRWMKAAQLAWALGGLHDRKTANDVDLDILICRA